MLQLLNLHSGAYSPTLLSPPYISTSSVAQLVKNLPEMQEAQVLSLRGNDPLDEVMEKDPTILF